MSPGFDDSSVAQDVDRVREHCRCEPVRHDDRDSVFCPVSQLLDEFLFGPWIHCTGGLVEHQDG